MNNRVTGPTGYNPVKGNQPSDTSEKIAQLKADFENNQSKTRMESAKALAQLGRENESILNFFLDHLNPAYDTATRQLSLHGLFELGHVTGIYKIASCLSDDNSDVRNFALVLLCSGSTGNTHPAVWGSRAFDSAINLLGDQDPTIRGNAAMLLGKIKDPRAEKQLVQKLEDGEQYVRHRVAYALGEIGTTGALNALMSALNNSIGDSKFEEIARDAIAKIKPPSGFTSSSYTTLQGLPENTRLPNDPYTGAEGYLSGEEDYQRRLQEQEEEYQRQLRAREEEEYQQRLREEEEYRRRQEEEQQIIFESYWASNDDNLGLW